MLDASKILRLEVWVGLMLCLLRAKERLLQVNMLQVSIEMSLVLEGAGRLPWVGTVRYPGATKHVNSLSQLLEGVFVLWLFVHNIGFLNVVETKSI